VRKAERPPEGLVLRNYWRRRIRGYILAPDSLKPRSAGHCSIGWQGLCELSRAPFRLSSSAFLLEGGAHGREHVASAPTRTVQGAERCSPPTFANHEADSGFSEPILQLAQRSHDCEAEHIHPVAPSRLSHTPTSVNRRICCKTRRGGSGRVRR